MSIVEFEIKDQVGFITFNRPEKYNAFNQQMCLRIQECLEECKSDEIRGVFITGNGKAFSAGQDLSEVADPEGPGIQRILSEHFNPIVIAIRELKKPVMAAVNGIAAGAGANLCLCCDICVATQSATFIQAFSKIGLIPDTGGTFFLPRLIGWQKASAFMMLGEKVDAVEAERLGMIYKYFPDESFLEESKKIITYLATMPTLGLAYTKKALQWSFTHTMYEQLQNEDKAQQWASKTEDFQEGLTAFLEKRKPEFKGK